MAALGDEEVRYAVEALVGWEVGTGEITRQFHFPGFADAVAFVVRLAFAAEAADHHPDVDIRYNRVRIGLSTHSEGGVTDKDLALARVIGALAPEAG